MDYNIAYGLGSTITSFAIKNELTTRLDKACHDLISNNYTFCFYADNLQSQWSVVDIAQMQGLVDGSKTLASDIATYRRQLYSACSFGALSNTEEMDRVLFFDYLLSVSVCYIEIPRINQKTSKKYYDKFLATRNPLLISAWTGIPSNEVQYKYCSRIQQSNIDFANNSVRVIKLTTSTKGNKLSVARYPIDVRYMRCIPLFMLYGMMDAIYRNLQKGILKFTFKKDNDVLRELCSTLNFGILLDYYKSDPPYIEKALTNTDIFCFDDEDASICLTSSQSRGHIQIPELGASRFDLSGVRALNLSRVLRIEPIKEVSREFIDIDLNVTVDNFKKQIDNLTVTLPDMLFSIYSDLGIKSANIHQGTPPSILQGVINSYVDSCDALYSTSFRRGLHRFMSERSDLFG